MNVIVNTLKLDFCGFDTHKIIFVSDEKTDRNVLNIDKIYGFFTAIP